ncbi:HAD-IA family hydrolase [Candidatus Pelagibacter bacterium nBUS_30]|uniref:HAD-IA family hydrolase n=1 Tax=Candidatus Pelagibacter bacterium nBUS_30 TaxID=3374191 RepID=UPI003EBFD4F7
MIKTIIFDLDGVLVNTKLIHFEALNISLKKFKFKEISLDDHNKIYDGLPTNEKLRILNKKQNLPIKYFSKINNYKQKITSQILKKNIKKDQNILKILRYLHKDYKIAVATNAVRSTLEICLSKLGILKYIDYKLSNEDINKPKPNPEIYLKIFIHFGIYPNEALIIEDSHYGREAAISSGAKLLPIKKLNELTLKKIKLQLLSKKNININKISWKDNKMNVLIPMAGAGKRFFDAGYMFPKPLIEVNNKPMIQLVLESLNLEANYIFIIQKDHQIKFNIKSVLKILQPECKIIELDHLTEGAACTTLLAKEFINNSDPLIIANSDQYIEWNSSKALYDFNSKNLDGAILTFEAIHPKWSYAKCNDEGYVIEVAEKKVISKNATVGVYYWKHGSDYVSSSEEMIKKNLRINNEFYVCPVYNEFLSKNKKVKIHNVDKMYGLGTPEDLNNYIRNSK